jgi:hypothetical protein
LKAESEQRHTANITSFFDGCAKGAIDAIRRRLAKDPRLAREQPGRAPRELDDAAHRGKIGQANAVRLLLEHGADPNAREAGDNTYPLHWAAAHGHLDTVRVLLDAGGDVHVVGDVHQLDVIGWATFFRAPGDDPSTIDTSRQPVVVLLVERGARHHISSAMSVGDLNLIRKVVEDDPDALDHRMSRFEQGQTDAAAFRNEPEAIRHPRFIDRARRRPRR